MKIHTQEIARKLLEQNILNDPGFSIKELFEIRDSCLTLARYGLADMNLLEETLKYIGQLVE